jgi:hypothetical protein
MGVINLSPAWASMLLPTPLEYPLKTNKDTISNEAIVNIMRMSLSIEGILRFVKKFVLTGFEQ